MVVSNQLGCYQSPYHYVQMPHDEGFCTLVDIVVLLHSGHKLKSHIHVLGVYSHNYSVVQYNLIGQTICS